MRVVLKKVPAIILLTFGVWHLSANAELISEVCQVNTINACENSNSTIPSAGILTIRGYAFDTAAGDRPVDTRGGYILVRNEDSLTDYKLPIQAIEARPDVVAASIEGTLEPENYDVVKAGFAAQVFMASLPVGRYSVQEVRINMKASGLVKLDLPEAGKRATFNISEGSSPFRIIRADGSSSPLSMGKASSGNIPVTGYPALRDGSYTIEATLPSVGGQIKKNVSFNYRRPVVTLPVSLPLVQDFPGLSTRMALSNPLNNRPLEAGMLPIVIEQVQSESVSIDGQALVAEKKLDLAKFPNATGVYQLRVKDSADTEGQQNIKLWLDLPDAPNVKLVTNRWDPDKKVVVDKSVKEIAVKVEDLDVQAKLNNPSSETCQLLRTLKADNIMGQFVGTDCAIKFIDMPDGMKYSTYFANALRGAVPNVGDNIVSYSVGVVYTDPTTKKTEFYPSKSGTSSINITGVEPASIELNFRNDKLVNPFYAENEAMFPGKHFALVDPSQARTLGVMGVKSAHRGVRTRVTYPGDEVREAYTSLLDSNVVLALKADTPWESQKVLVESWYEKAPEYKTTKEMEFVGIPIGPIVDLEKNFVSHDKADTLIRGNIGIAKGQNLVFDPAAMGAWQVSIVNEKTSETMAAPVNVAPDGSFTVNLGTLSSGTRYIVAEARMLTTSGNAANSVAVSKKRSLITAVGDTIEATLAVRNVSGKAPFVQTIVTNFSDPKMQSNVKNVSWEVLASDGTWQPVLRNGSADTSHIGISYIATVTEPGEAQYRAVLINKYSGATYTTEPIKLTAFDVPSFKVNNPAVVQAKRAVVFTIEAEQGFDAEYTWRLLTTGRVEDVGPTNGSTFTFTPMEVATYAVEVIGRQAGAPDNPAANVKKTASVRAVNPLTARASISGPRLLEVGKQHEFKATINDVVSSSSDKDYVLKGYWLLPDGTRVDGTELTFSPRIEDKLLSFYTYVEGYPEETSVATYTFSTWKYQWPTSWQLRLQPVYLEVPASIKFFLETPGDKMSDLKGELLTYTWSLPNGITQVSGGDLQGTLAISKYGNYQVAVQVADTRGNTVNVVSDEFSILPPATVETQVSMVSKYGENFYAPGSYYVSTKTVKLPRGDSFLRHEILINGQKVGESTGSGHYVSFAAPGAYEVMVRTITKAGNYGEQIINLQVQEPPPPTCDIKISNTTSGISVVPTCVVDAGYVKSYTWTYVLDGQEKKSSTKSFLIAKQWLAANTIGSVSLEVETDLGGKIVQEINYR